jgi:hypothetical protein
MLEDSDGDGICWRAVYLATGFKWYRILVAPVDQSQTEAG